MPPLDDTPVSAAPVTPLVVDTPAAPVAPPVVDTPAAQEPVAPRAPTAPELAATVAAEPHPAEIPSLLEEAGKKPAAEAVKPGEEAKTETAVEAPAETAKPIEWDFKLPETLKADDATIGKFKENLSSLLQPKDGETPSHAAQRLLDMHGEALANYAKQIGDEQVRVWNETRKSWRTQAMADPEIGGAGHKTAMGAIARVRDAVLSEHKAGSAAYQKDVQEFNDFLRVTGAGDHPVFLKALHRAARYIDEPAVPSTRAAPPPDAGRKPGRRQLYSE